MQRIADWLLLEKKCRHPNAKDEKRSTRADFHIFIADCADLEEIATSLESC